MTKIYDSFGNAHDVLDDFVLTDGISYDPMPDLLPDQIAQIVDNKWVVDFDYRQKMIWLKLDSNQLLIVGDLGDIDPKYTLIAPDNRWSIFNDDDQKWSSNKDLEDALISKTKASKRLELTTSRDIRIDGFDTITIAKGEFYIDRVGLNKLSNRLTAKPRANDNDVITSYVTTALILTDLTKLDVIEILDHQDDIESMIYAYHVDLINQVNNAATVDEINAIIWDDQVKQKEK